MKYPFRAKLLLNGLRGGVAAAVAVTLTAEPTANRVYQRTTSTGGGYGKGQGSLTVTATTAATTPIYARLRSSGSGNPIMQAPFLAAASFSGGSLTISGLDVVDVAANPNDGLVYLDIAPSASGPWTQGTQAFMIGRVIGWAGQSLAVRMLAHVDDTTNTITTLGITPSPYSRVLATYNESRAYMPTVSTLTWQSPATGGTYDGAMTAEFLRRQVGQFGVACGWVGHAQGGVSITTFLAGGANATQLAAVIAQAGGSFESFIWYQGHTEASYGCPANVYSAALTTLFSQITALNSRGSSYSRYIGSIPNINNTAWGDPFERNNLRAAMESWAATNANGGAHVQMQDLALYDGVHELQTGGLTMAQHFARATRPEAGLSNNDRGPALLSATRSGTTITATFSDVGQSTLVLTGTPGSRIFAFPTGYRDKWNTTTNRFPVSSVSVTDKTTLSIVLANDPGDGNVLDLLVYWPNDNANDGSVSNIRDDRTDGDGIAVGRSVMPNQAAVSIAAPVPASTVNNPPSGAPANVSPFNMTATSPTYGTQEQTGFNQTMSGGTALAAANTCPAFTPFTIEGWFTYLAAPAGTQVLFGGVGSEFVAISTAGKITTNGGTGSTSLIAGHRYHVAYQRGPSGAQMYLTDVTAAGSGAQILYSATAFTLNPAATAYGLRVLGGSFALSAATATIDDFAVFSAARYSTSSGATYTAPTVPFTPAAANIVALYHCDGDVKDAAAA